jgi:putative ABC transport system ATP-binding protein
MLQLEDVTLAYGDNVLLRHFDLTVNRGEMVCLQGGSGCGKTSLLRAVMGFVPVRQGRVVVDGLPLGASTVDGIRRRMAYLPQELSLPAHWVHEMVAMPFRLKANRGCRFSKELLLAEWEKMGLDAALYEQAVSEISGGQRQRMMLCVSAMLNKPLILADEPTSALDSDSALRVLAYFREKADAGTAILMVSHDEAFARGCDRIVRL